MNPRAASLLPLFLAACATGSAAETKAITQPLGSFPSASVVVTAADPAATNANKRVTACQIALEAGVNAAGVFGSVIREGEPAGAALQIRATLVDETERLLGIEKHQKVLLQVTLVDAKDQSTVGALDVRGTSDDGSSSSVNGVDMAIFDDLIKKACEAAGAQLRDFLKTKK